MLCATADVSPGDCFAVVAARPGPSESFVERRRAATNQLLHAAQAGNPNQQNQAMPRLVAATGGDRAPLCERVPSPEPQLVILSWWSPLWVPAGSLAAAVHFPAAAADILSRCSSHQWCVRSMPRRRSTPPWVAHEVSPPRVPRLLLTLAQQPTLLALLTLWLSLLLWMLPLEVQLMPRVQKLVERRGLELPMASLAALAPFEAGPQPHL